MGTGGLLDKLQAQGSAAQQGIVSAAAVQPSQQQEQQTWQQPAALRLDMGSGAPPPRAAIGAPFTPREVSPVRRMASAPTKGQLHQPHVPATVPNVSLQPPLHSCQSSSAIPTHAEPVAQHALGGALRQSETIRRTASPSRPLTTVEPSARPGQRTGLSVQAQVVATSDAGTPIHPPPFGLS